jgi:hypothetical protein
MNEMIERVARAMMRTTNIPEHNDVETCSLDWCGDDLWSCDFEAMARAAIEAMREPTGAMVWTGTRYMDFQPNNPKYEHLMAETFKAMIDEALSDE